MKNQLHEDETLLTRHEAAEYLNVTLRCVTRCAQERRIQYMRVGHKVRIPATAINEYISWNTAPALNRRNLR
jgi:excisionase family DNA binding protein